MINYTPPKIEESINRLQYRWDSMDLLVVADRITEAGVAELSFYHANGTGNRILHIAKTNLLSTPTINGLIRRMGTHSVDIPWTEVLTCVSTTTMEYQRRGEPPVVIEPYPGDVEKPTYYVEPLIMRGVPNIIYGDKGSNKTTISLAALGLLYTGCDYTSWGLIASQSAKIGLLDWESSPELTRYTTSRLIEGGTVPYFQLPYLRCKQPLQDDIERIANFVSDHEIDVVLIDSLGQAAGSDKFDSSGKASALKFFECLRQLNVTSLIIAQNSKAADTNQKTIYGSTYFTYYARNIFELKRSKDRLLDDELSVALFHREANYSKQYDTKGFHIKYTDQKITITSESVNFAQFMDKISQPSLIIDFLKNGAQSRAAIMKMLNKTSDQVSPVLNRMKRDGKIIDLGSGMWGLTASEDFSDD